MLLQLLSLKAFRIHLSWMLAVCTLFAALHHCQGARAEASKTLHAGVSDTGIFTEELQSRLGLGVARLQGKLVVALILPGKAASAGVKERDTILDARIDDDVLSMTVARGGKSIPLKIELVSVVEALPANTPAATRLALESGQKPVKPLQQSVRLSTPNDIAIYGFRNANRGLTQTGLNNPAGWTEQAYDDANAFNAEVGSMGINGALSKAWGASLKRADPVCEAFMKTWPKHLIGVGVYHLTCDRQGHVTSYCKGIDNCQFASDARQFDQQAYALISQLSSSGVLSVPPASKVERLQTELVIENCHDRMMKY